MDASLRENADGHALTERLEPQRHEDTKNRALGKGTLCCARVAVAMSVSFSGDGRCGRDESRPYEHRHRHLPVVAGT
jgi:hypothetical protein